MNLQSLSLDELLRHAYTQLNDLTSSDLERELFRRLELTNTDAYETMQELEISSEELLKLHEAGLDLSIDEQVAILNAAQNQAMDVNEVVGVLEILNEQHIESPEEFKELFELVDAFRTIATDAGDVIDRLSTLIYTAQEE